MTDTTATPPLLGGGPIGANPSFFDLIATTRPELLSRVQATGAMPDVPHGTTVLGLKCEKNPLPISTQRND